MNRFKLINSIIDDTNLTLSEKSLLVALWRFSDTSNYSFPSVETLMNASSIGSKNTFLKARKSLVEKGYISYITHKNKPCEYFITFGSAKMNQYKSDSAILNDGSSKIIPFGGSKMSDEQNNNTTNNINNINIPDSYYYNWMEETSTEFIVRFFQCFQ